MYRYIYVAPLNLMLILINVACASWTFGKTFTKSFVVRNDKERFNAWLLRLRLHVFIAGGGQDHSRKLVLVLVLSEHPAVSKLHSDARRHLQAKEMSQEA